MTRPTDPLFDQRIADWLEGDPVQAPDQVLEIVLAALPSIPRRRASRVPRRLIAMPTSIRWPLAAAAVIGVLVLGGALYLNRPTQPSVGGPSPTPGVSASPSQPANPTASPSPTAVPARTASWTATGSMVFRGSGTATLLPNGKVLVASGTAYGTLADTAAELYDPATGSWTATGKMLVPGADGTATLLSDGRVLVVAGADFAQSAELYDPATGSWTRTGSMTAARYFFSATLLQDGRVLVAGGQKASAELYDPATGTWARTGSMRKARFSHTATLLPDGKVLVAGGAGNDGLGGGCCGPLASAELYDPATGTWTSAGNMTTGRVKHTATLLRDGRVLVAAGAGGPAAELYDPGTGTWTATGRMTTTAAVGLSATLLPNGRVLLAGGWNLHLDAQQNAIAVASADLYDPASGTWTATAAMTTPRMYHMATLLPDGMVLVAGGSDLASLASAELYDPGTGR